MTQTLLRIDVSPRGEDSVSRQLSQRIIDRLAPETVLTRDLTRSLPLLDAAWVGANFTPADQRSAEQDATLKLSDELIAELRQADTIVIGLPVWNFGVPAALKAWIDLIARVGETFKYTEEGPQGLLTGKRAIIALASGGTEMNSAIDFATPYLRHMLGFVGIDQVDVVAADKLAIDADATLKAANDAVDALVA